MLQDDLPSRQVEVFNLGITSIASFAVAQTLADALPLVEPDAVVVYTGHNEFYGIYGSHQEHRTHLYNTLHYNLMRWRIPQLLGGLVDALRPSGVSSRNLLESLGERGQVSLTSRRRRLAQEDLETNLRRVIALCRASETPLVLCTLVSMTPALLRPHPALPPLTGVSLGQWQTWVDSAATVLIADKKISAEEGLAALEQAAALWARFGVVAVFAGAGPESTGKAPRGLCGLCAGAGSGHNALAGPQRPQRGDPFAGRRRRHPPSRCRTGLSATHPLPRGLAGD